MYLAFDVLEDVEIARKHFHPKSIVRHVRNQYTKKYCILSVREESGTKSYVFFGKDKQKLISFKDDFKFSEQDVVL